MDLSKVRDRGMKKWSMMMMLPEHAEELKKWRKEDEYTEKPYLDEFELTLIAEEVERAFKGKSMIKLTYWRDGKLLDDYGVPIKIDTINKELVIDDPFGTTKYSFEEIVVVSLVE